MEASCLLDLNEEQKEAIRSFGALEYSADLAAKVINIPYELRVEFIHLYNTPGNYINDLVEEGFLANEYAIDLKLMELAKNGDNAALKSFNIRKNNRKY